jgi:acyl carrier protein
MEDLKQFIQQQIIELAFKKVGYEDSLIKAKVLDSITLVELIVAIEENTGKRFPQHLVNDDNFETINKIAETANKI